MASPYVLWAQLEYQNVDRFVFRLVFKSSNSPSFAQVASTASLDSSPTITTPTTLTVNPVMPLTNTSIPNLSFTGVCVHYSLCACVYTRW